jgi:hypothetical protein
MHDVGEQITFDPLGNLILEKCPQRVCHHAMVAGVARLVAAGAVPRSS